MLGTVVSRILGLLRDTATASLLGMSGSTVLDALVLAFRIPNLFRGLLGEGALAASFLPEFTSRLQSDRPAAHAFASQFLRQLTGVLLVVVVMGEAICGVSWLLSAGSVERQVLLELVATTLPYLLLICLSAQLSAMLNATGNFRIPALLPSLLNACWLLGVCWLAPAISDSAIGRAHVVAVCILLGGVAQICVQLPALRRAGIRLDFRFVIGGASLKKLWTGFAGTTLGLAITQLNTLIDCLFAWGLAVSPTRGATMPWLGWRYPLQNGATSALYFGERMYQLPLGLIGVATATVVFPRLARHVAGNDRRALGQELTRSLKFTLLLALPAGVGLMILSQPIARLLFEHGNFTRDDSLRTANVIATYAAGVWAYCLLPVLIRGFYAVGDRRLPIRTGVLALLINVTLDMALVWPLGEVGLAAATAISASVQTIVLVVLFARRHAALDVPELQKTTCCAVLAAACLSLATWLTHRGLAGLMVEQHSSAVWPAMLVIAPMLVGAGIYGAVLFACHSADPRQAASESFGRLTRLHTVVAPLVSDCGGRHNSRLPADDPAQYDSQDFRTMKTLFSFAIALGCAGSLPQALFAAEHGKAITDVARAGPDYAIQGEYASDKSAAAAYGVQVVARGEGKFEAAVLEGGLPGAGFQRSNARSVVKGTTANGATKFSSDKWSLVIDGDKLILKSAIDDKSMELKKVNRVSPTLGAKPPAGAVVLFDGSNADRWKNGQLTEDKLLMSGPTSKDQFKDFTLHLEFRCPFMPESNGQARGNSGVYVHGRYEVQVLDSFGLEGKEDDCGGIYKAATAKVNMSFPPLVWQTYDIDMTAPRFEGSDRKAKAKLTVKHNGVIIHDAVELPGPTPGGVSGGEDTQQDPLFLQNHGNPVVFRNIWVVEKK